MFAPRLASSAFGQHPKTMPVAHLYGRIGVETGVADASPHRLVTMLFDGYAEAVSQAKGALASGQIEAKCVAIGRAVRIVNEGLKDSLDLTGGGSLASGIRSHCWIDVGDGRCRCRTSHSRRKHKDSA